MTYNQWYTDIKVNEEQKQCGLCNKWDKYFYNVTLKQTEENTILCFQCYHGNHETNMFDEVD